MTAYELQVLAGEQQGARVGFPGGHDITVSGAFDSDVVLRGDGLSECRIALRAEGDGLQLRVLQGKVEAAGLRIEAGQTLSLPLTTPLCLGSVTIGVVRLAGEPAHAAASASGAGVGGPVSTPADAGAHAMAAEHAAGAFLTSAVSATAATPTSVPATQRLWPRRLVAAGGALASVSIGVLAFAYNATPTVATPEQQARRAEAVLHGAGLQRLAVRADADGGLRVDGSLETASQRVLAEQLLAGERSSARWHVWIDEQVVAAVADVFRVHGVHASVDRTGPGAVRVRTAVAEPHVLEGIRVAARRDVPGLLQMEIVNEPTVVRAGPVPVQDDPGKRVSAIVPGDPAYLVTVDGTRYFQGALLPTGHRIVGIEERRVVLDFNGVQTPLVF